MPTMERTQIYLTSYQKKKLASYAASAGVSQSELIRQSIDTYINSVEETDKEKVLGDIAGIWANRQDLPDIRKLRKGWKDRPS